MAQLKGPGQDPGRFPGPVASFLQKHKNIQEAKSIGLKQNLKGNQLTESVAQQLILTDTYKNPTYKGTINAKEYKSVSEFAKSKDFDGAGVYIVKVKTSNA